MVFCAPLLVRPLGQGPETLSGEAKLRPELECTHAVDCIQSISMTDLYATLGVPKDADHATIRAAYRKRAKAAHPDGGGSPSRFALVKLAHDTLTDDARRARYDETGEVEDKPVDNRRAQLLEMLAAGLDVAMTKLYERAKPPIHADMVKLTKEALREMRQKWTGERREFQKNVDRSRELLGRWTTKAQTENLMETIVAHRVKVCDGQIAMLTQRIEVVDRALEALDGVSFRFDHVPESSPAQTWMNGGISVSIGDILGGRR